VIACITVHDIGVPVPGHTPDRIDQQRVRSFDTCAIPIAND
jgi:hypothetical protein